MKCKWFTNANKTRERAFGDESVVSDYDAMVFCLKLAWAAYIAKHPRQVCPYDFAES